MACRPSFGTRAGLARVPSAASTPQEDGTVDHLLRFLGPDQAGEVIDLLVRVDQKKHEHAHVGKNGRPRAGRAGLLDPTTDAREAHPHLWSRRSAASWARKMSSLRLRNSRCSSASPP